MNSIDLPTMVWLLAGALGALALALILCLRKLWRQSGDLARQKELIDSEGKKRVEKSRSVLLGQVAEHFAPLLPGFAYNPKDARFLGQPVDYLVFNGLNDSDGPRQSDGPGEIEIVFCEIKTGVSQLSANEKAIRDAVAAGRVRFEVMRLDKNGHIQTV